MISIKNDEEIRLMKEAGRIVAVVLNELKNYAQVGIETQELDEKARRLIKSFGGKPAFLGYRGYPYAICVSLNSEVVHGFPSDQSIKVGDIISLDLGVEIDGFLADAAITFGIGRVDPENQRLIKATEEALYIGLAQAKEGNYLGQIGSSIEEHVKKEGFSVVREFVGHGIGKNLHEGPSIPNYSLPITTPLLKKGMTLAIEPMVAYGKGDIYITSNGWTAKTKDGSIAAHFEHTVLVTPQGGEVITSV